MADKLIFPIGFDLEAAVKQAQGDAERLLRRLETTIKSRPLAVNLKIDGAGTGSINEINKRMSELIKQWNNLTEAERIHNKKSGEYTPQAKKIIAEYVRLTGATESYARTLQQLAAAARKSANEQEKNVDKQRKLEATLKASENSIDNVTAKLQHYRKEMKAADVGSAQFSKAAAEVKRLTTRLAELQSRVQMATGVAKKEINSVTQEMEKQDGYVSRLVKRLAVYASFSAVGNLLASIREVTAEFELQRVSLGAIIQDQQRANELFSEIKAFALKSPLKILDLTKYTKQVAAYGFETEKLFDTTKRLADISVGLGVDMQRLTLFLGQVFATGYLRGCLGHGTKVEMWNGSAMEVQDISVGDMLMGDDETPRTVKKLYRGVQQMYVVDCDGVKFRCNEHHILTLYNTTSNEIEDVYVFDYLKSANRYKGIKRIDGDYEYCDIYLTKDTVDNYYGFEIDGNKRFIIEDNIVTHNSEVRQATEAGIPLVEKLAQKFSELEGKTVSAAEVMDRISKRMVSFSMVEEVFQDMTNAGGEFYNMQEKQSQTLYGMWAKMGDAAAVMYEQMGNTAVANSAMKGTIQLMSDMMLHWTALANVAQTAVTGFLLYKAAIAGIIPFYGLQTKLTINQIKAEKARLAQQTQMLAMGRALTREEQLQILSKNKLMAADYQRLITEGKLSAAQKISLGRQAATNVQLRRAVIEMGLFTKAQINALGAMSGWQFFMAKFKLQIAGVGQAFMNFGRSIMAFLPLAALTAITDLFMDWRNAVAAQEEAVKKVDKQYEEMKVTLMEIRNAYEDVKNATKEAGVSEDEFIKTSYSQKLEQLKKVIKLLGNFGMKNVIDPSVLNYTNIDPALDKWLAKLNEVNELARGWGREVALVANAYEGNIFGWSIFGENLKEDMKDLERSWTKLTVNSEFNQSLSQLRAIVGNLANDNKAVYDNIGKAIGADLKLALSQKRRNESELQYQQRIYKNYQNIESLLQSYRKKGEYKGMLPSLSSSDAGDVFADFQKDVDEVMHEFDKIKEKFRDQDALSVKMAIDTIAAENDWTEWQKELLIQHLNEDPITLNAEIIPTGDVAGQGAVAEGMKAIISTEFPDLFSPNDLQSLVSMEGIVDAIKAKLDASNKSLEEAYQLQNNLTYGSKGFEKSLDKVKKLQQEISDIEDMRAELQALEDKNGDLTSDELLRRSELQAKLQELDEQAVNNKRAEIAALVEANSVTEENIRLKREQAEADREMAKAALERVTSMGLSDLGKDIKEQFAGLRVDAVKEITDNNYSTDFLISDEELRKIRDVGDLYEMWAKNTKAIKDEKEKLVGVGITEATIEKERADLEAKRAKIQLQLNEVEAAISNEKFKGQEAQYASLKLALANATTADAQKKAQDDLNKYLGDTKNAEFAILLMKREGLKTSLQEALVSQAANDQIAEYLKGLDDAEELWKKLGERYNFKLHDKNKKGGSGEDPWIILMKNRMKFMQDFQKGVEDLSKWMGKTKGLADEQENMLGRGLSVQIDSRELDGSKEELIKWYEDAIVEIRKKIAGLGGKEWEGLGVQMILAKDTKNRVIKKYQELLQEMWKNLTDFRTDQAQKALEKQLKDLADRVSRTKTAKEFYEKILSQTGDVELAKSVSLSIYGDDGAKLFEQTVEQIKQVFKTGSKELDDTIEMQLDFSIDTTNQRINYQYLAEIYDYYQDQIIEKNRDTAQKIISEGQKTAASNISTWEKELAKAKDYEEQRTDIINRETQRRAEIYKSTLPQEEKDRLVTQSQMQQDKEISDLNWKEFKESDDYIKIFENLDNVSTAALKRLRENLEQVKAANADLSPENMKALVKAMEDIDEQISGRGFGNDMVQGVKDYIQAVRDLKAARTELQASQAEYDAQLPQLDADIDAAKQEEIAAQTALNLLKQDELATENQIVAAELRLNAAASNVANAENKKAQAANKVKTAEQNVTNQQDKQKKATSKFFKDMQQVAQTADQLASLIGDIQESLGISADSAEGVAFDSAIQGLNEFSKILNVIIGLQTVYNIVTSSNPWLAIAAAVLAVGQMLGSFIANNKVRKANEEIERQQKLLERLEYTYSRVEKAAEKAFGGDYINNFKRQQQILEAQAEAYRRQAEAERSKGKKADKDKIKEYENSYRDTMDEIADMQGQIAAQMLGSDLTSAARDFAQAWLDAYKEFGNTADAMSEKFQEMIQNMVVESLLAKAMERALKPVFDMIDNYDGDFKDPNFWRSINKEAETATQNANFAGKAIMDMVSGWGINVRKTGSELTGISRDIASASESDINGLAVGITTQNAYMAQILEEVRLIRAGRTPITVDSSYADSIAIQNDSLSNLQAIERHTAEMVLECRKAAAECAAISKQLSSAITAKGSSVGFNVFMK